MITIQVPASYGDGQNLLLASPTSYGYGFGFATVRVVNPYPYLQTMASSMPLLPLPTANTRIINRPVYPLNLAYPVIMPVCYQAPLEPSWQTGGWDIPHHIDSYSGESEAIVASANDPVIPQMSDQPKTKRDISTNTEPLGDRALQYDKYHAPKVMFEDTKAPADDELIETEEDDITTPQYTASTKTSKNEEVAPPPIEMREDFERKLKKALKHKKATTVFKLLENKKNKDLSRIINSQGENLLFIACTYKHYKLAEFLLSSSEININQCSKDGFTPLHMACHKGDTDLVSLLLTYGADCLAHDKILGQSPLHIAAQRNNKQLISMLLNKLVDKKQLDGIDATDSNGFTPLMLAAKRGHTRAVSALLQYNADALLTVPDGNIYAGKTAYDLADLKRLNILTKMKLKERIKRLNFFNKRQKM
ncbi:MAG: ankyrin repeat domain-containing protein [Endozoicomonas sp. (ex Botrylloides leachii)]|nr:ankyrin repeat domain-containing protein [Endozoicomonas sp. (ex Botrylloides leachii)]